MEAGDKRVTRQFAAKDTAKGHVTLHVNSSLEEQKQLYLLRSRLESRGDRRWPSEQDGLVNGREGLGDGRRPDEGEGREEKKKTGLMRAKEN